MYRRRYALGQAIAGIAALLTGSLPGISAGFAAAQQSAGVSWSQWRINEVAAEVERTRRALMEDTGLRLPAEPLPAYLKRIARPLAGEAPETYRARIEGYLAALQRVSTVTASLRRAPPLRHASVANRISWERAIRALNYLPGRLVKVRAAWQQALRNPQSAAETDELGRELHQTLQQLMAAFAALRDARP